MICCTSILWKRVFLCSYHSYTAPIIYPQFLWPRYVFYTMMASQFSSMVQARPGYFGSEFLKTERNLHTTVVQKKWMFKLHHIPPNGSIKFAAWLCKQITPHRLWWWWVKCKEVLLYDDTNSTHQSFPFEMAALDIEIFLSETPREPREQTLFQLQTESVTRVMSWYCVLLHKEATWPTECRNLHLCAYVILSGRQIQHILLHLAFTSHHSCGDATTRRPHPLSSYNLLCNIVITKPS